MVMNIRFSAIAQAFFWSIFSGIIGIGIGLGAAIPPLNYVAAPFVCPGGTMTNSTQGYTVSPVESVTTVSLYCVDKATGSATEVNMFPTVLYSGVIYGLVVFAAVLALMLISANRRGARQSATYTDSLAPNRMQGQASQSPVMRQQDPMESRSARAADPRARLEKLKEMLSSGLITQQEYDQKKKEILEEL
jgi:hypothetical protein